MSDNLSVLNNENEAVQSMQNADLQQMMTPIMQCIAQVMIPVAESMRAMQDTLKEMQRDAAFRTPLTSTQKGHLNAAVRERAQSVVKKYKLPKEAYNEAMREIRKKLYRRWGVKAVGDIPSSEYQSAIQTVDNWDASSNAEKYM